MMPNFLVIGTNKAGTTSLYHYLNQHPQIYMSRLKEPSFFAIKGIGVDRSIPDYKKLRNATTDNFKDYEALFAEVTDEKAIGEASTAYMAFPQSARRIKQYIPNVKLIAVLRDPANRAFSNYLMLIRRKGEKLSFEQALEEERKYNYQHPIEWRHYVRYGFYYEQLRRYYELFDEDQIQVHLYEEDYRANPSGMLQNIYKFIGVDEGFSAQLDTKFNVSRLSKSKALRLLLEQPNFVTDRLKSFQHGRRVMNNIRKWNAIEVPPMSTEIRRMLIKIYRQDILKLQDLIDRDLSPWLAY